MALPKESPGTKIAVLALALVSVYLVVQALAAPEERTRTPQYPHAGELCMGESIMVDYPYGGGLLGPHECKVQCGTDQRYYILYTNGQATQCEPLPGCSDWGEDNSILCEPPMSQ